MRKLCIVLVLVLALALLIACNGETPNTTTTGTPDSTTTTPITGGQETPTMKDGETVEKENYTAIQNAAKWDSSFALSENYDFTGSGSSIYSTAMSSKYQGYKKTYIVVENGVETTLKPTEIVRTLNKIELAGIKEEMDKTAKTVTFRIYKINAVVMPSFTAVTAKAGYYLMFDFTTNVEASYCVTVTTTPGGSKTSAADVQPDITTTGKNGKFTGIAKCNIPHAVGKTYYINICTNGGQYTTLASIPLQITAPKYDLPFRFIFQGDWDAITDRSYVDNLFEVLYNSYPRAYQRWAFNGDESKTLYVVADKKSEAIAYNAGDKVVVQVAYANSSPADVGLFAHEFTHAIQAGYGISYDNGWFTEAMADYGRFRFFHWGYSVNYIKDYSMNSSEIRDFRKDKNDPTSQWYGYAQHNLFMTYLDWTWPTTDKNDDQTITPDEYGLIDYIVYKAKMWQKEGKSPVSDYPYTKGSTFNNWVKDITGIDTMELVRQQFVKELDEGTWTFNGFRDFPDNFLIENVYDIPDLIYPMKEKIEPTAKTNPMLAVAVTTGDNLCKGAVICSTISAGTSDKYLGKFMIDGDLETRYQAKVSSGLYKLTGSVQNEVVIDLGAVKTFDTYTLVSYDKQASFITKSWEILVSEDGVNYTAVDYQKNNKEATVSVSFDDVSARYVKLRLYQADLSGGTTRIPEFMLFDANK